MSLEVLDAFTRSKSGDPDLNEDAYVVCDELVAVFDGETDKYDSGIPSPGRQASRALCEAVGQMPSGISPVEAAELMHESVAALEIPNAVAVGAVLDVPARRVVRIGDVSVRVGNELWPAFKRSDDIAAKARAVLMESLLKSGAAVETLQEDDPGYAMVMPMLRAVSAWRNNPGSYLGFAAIDGSRTPKSMIDVIEVPPGSQVVLATDGYDRVLGTLAQTEEVLAASVSRDPLRIGIPPGVKGVPLDCESFDDRTYVRVQL